MKIPQAITIDLQNGMGLEECLIKHGTNLKTLFSNVSSGYPKVSNEETMYIEKINKTIRLLKNQSNLL